MSYCRHCDEDPCCCRSTVSSDRLAGELVRIVQAIAAGGGGDAVYEATSRWIARMRGGRARRRAAAVEEDLSEVLR